MVERVQTGGAVNFEYKNRNSPTLNLKQKKEIAEAYEQYHERKKSEKRKRNILIIIAVLVALIILFLILRATS